MKRIWKSGKKLWTKNVDFLKGQSDEILDPLFGQTSTWAPCCVGTMQEESYSAKKIEVQNLVTLSL